MNEWTKRRYNTLKNMDNESVTRLNERIKNIPDKEEREVCRLYIQESRSTTEIASMKVIKSKSNINKGEYVESAASIYRVVNKYFPDVFEARKQCKSKSDKYKYTERKRTQKLREKSLIKTCAKCGSSENIEIHHMIPLFLGGDTSEFNCIALCRKCHREVTNYHRDNYNGYLERFKAFHGLE